MKRPKKMTTEEIREELQSYVLPRRGESLRWELKARGRKYKPFLSPESALEFIEKNGVHFNVRENHNQSQNHPYVYTLFTIPSQHVMGDSVAECIDRAFEKSTPPKSPPAHRPA